MVVCDALTAPLILFVTPVALPEVEILNTVPFSLSSFLLEVRVIVLPYLDVLYPVAEIAASTFAAVEEASPL